MRVVLIGHGRFGRIYREHLEKRPDYKLVAVVDENPKALEDVRGCSVLLGYEEANNIEHDAVIICTTPEAHTEYTMAALENGKHVYCMKPGAMNLREALIINSLVKGSRLCHKIDYTPAWCEENGFMRDLFHTIGFPLKMSSIRSVMGAPRPEGIILDLFSHDVALCTSMEFFGRRDELRVRCHVDGVKAAAHLSVDDHDVAFMMATYNAVPRRRKLHFDVYPQSSVTNPRFVVTWDQDSRIVNVESQSKNLDIVFAPKPDPIDLGLSAFLVDVEAASWGYVTHHDWFMQTMEILSAMMESAENNNKVVKL